MRAKLAYTTPIGYAIRNRCSRIDSVVVKRSVAEYVHHVIEMTADKRFGRPLYV